MTSHHYAFECGLRGKTSSDPGISESSRFRLLILKTGLGVSESQYQNCDINTLNLNNDTENDFTFANYKSLYNSF